MEDDLKGCDKEHWGDGRPHGNVYYQLLPSWLKHILKFLK